MAAKNADFCVVNTSDAMGAAKSAATVLSRTATILPWAVRPKHELAVEIVKLISSPR